MRRAATCSSSSRFPRCVCNPALLEVHGRPCDPRELQARPLLYHLAWPLDCSHWFTAQGRPVPDLSRASVYRLSSMLFRAAAEGMGVAIGPPAVVARELKRGALVPLFERYNEAVDRCFLTTAFAAMQKSQVQAFRQWNLRERACASG